VHRDRGSVTLEAALVLPILLLVSAVLMWGMGVGFTALAMGDSVRTSARLIARGDDPHAVMARLQESLPDSDLELQSRGSDVLITAQQFVPVPMPVFGHLGLTISQSATAPLESSR